MIMMMVMVVEQRGFKGGGLVGDSCE